jgi:CubicO group peptidase (beta-lactamase class C family)
MTGIKPISKVALLITLLLSTQAGQRIVAQDRAQKANKAADASKPDAPKPDAATRKLIARLEMRIPELLSQGDVPGLSVALIKDSHITWSRGFGFKNAETKEPVDDLTMFEAGSLSKPVFAYAVLKMVEKGQLDLDAPLSKYLPAYIENDERLNLITARRVLSHTTGFPNWRPMGKPLVIHFTPGEKFSYSGEGFVYLQKVVERLTGEPLNEVIRKSVFEPLAMTNSTYVWQDRIDAQMSTGHNQTKASVQKNTGTQANAAASLRTTAIDYARFVIAVMNGEGLKEETIRQMLTAQVKVDAGCTNCIDRKPSKPSESLSWGLGWGLQSTAQGDAFWHWGDNGNFKCFIMAFRKQKMGVVAFTNSTNGLGIIPEIVGEAIGGNNPAFAWLDYETYNSPRRRLQKAIERDGVESALTRYRASVKENPAANRVNEGQMNSLGYVFLRSKRFKEAIEIFKLNVEAFPNSFNAYDSLGEAYMENGEKELAIQNYKKSVELNPNNTNGIEILKKLLEK